VMKKRMLGLAAPKEVRVKSPETRGMRMRFIGISIKFEVG
jgi:hypothetical protein